MKKEFVSVLSTISSDLPFYERLSEMQRVAMAEGWRWPEISPVIAKTEEELNEVKEAIAAGRRNEIVEELGDLIFMATLLCHYMDVTPAEAIESVAKKFAGRFGHVERRAFESGRRLTEVPHEEERQWYMEFKLQEKKQA